MPEKLLGSLCEFLGDGLEIIAPFLLRIRASNDFERFTPGSPLPCGDVCDGACRNRSGIIGMGGGGAAAILRRIKEMSYSHLQVISTIHLHAPTGLPSRRVASISHILAVLSARVNLPISV